MVLPSISTSIISPFQVVTIYEYEGHNLKAFQRRWYKQKIVIHPNTRSRSFPVWVMLREFTVGSNHLVDLSASLF